MKSLTVLLMVIPMVWFQTGLQNVDARLARAEDLYYQARFQDSIDALLTLDQDLSAAPRMANERVVVKLQLALAYVGLNLEVEAGSRFLELLGLNPDFELNRELYPPKVLALFDQARTRFGEGQCREICVAAGRALASSDADAIRAQLAAAPRSCQCASDIASDAADFYFEQGADAYESGNHELAIERFRVALSFESDHAQAFEASRIAENEIAERLVAQWNQAFNENDYSRAQTVYRQLLETNVTGEAGGQIEAIDARYRESVASLVARWPALCAGQNLESMEAILVQVSEMLPAPGIASDMTQNLTCTSDACFQLSTAEALRRVVTRVSPDLNGIDRRGASSTTRAALHIDARGNVQVEFVENGSAGIETATRRSLESWTFRPPLVGGDDRCIRTTLSFFVDP